MRKFIIFILFSLVPISLFAQAQILTKKEKLSDFPNKITKVVLLGNDFKDRAIKEAVNNSWHISPFEFCDMQSFEKLKTNPDLYFLMLVNIRNKKESKPGISAFTLIKGDKNVKSIDDMLEVISIPVCAADSPSGKEMAMMPALLDMMQEYVSKSLVNGFSSIGSIVKNLKCTKNMALFFDKEDFSPQIDSVYVSGKFDKQIIVGDEGTVIRAMMDANDMSAVGYVICPSKPQKGSLCYLMLFNAGTHELYYFKKRKIGGNLNVGFMKSDINKIISFRK